MILIIDNYDSFVYNLSRYVVELGHETQVYRNDAITLSDIEQLQPSHMIISPGPCSPNEAGISLALISHFMKTIPILGVCLGHQAIGQALGGQVVRATWPMHGKADTITNTGEGIFKGLPPSFQVARYHSLIVTKESIPAELKITATTKRDEVMAFQHQQYPLVGVQFHPESVLTEHGYAMIENFLSFKNPKTATWSGVSSQDLCRSQA